MRHRNPYPNTTSPSSEPALAESLSAGRPSASAGQYHFVITEKGLRACGAEEMEKTASRLQGLRDNLRQVAPSAARELHNLAGGLQRSAGQLMQDMPPEPAPATGRRLQLKRYGTVCGRYRGSNDRRVADLRLCGLWLQGAGFRIGQKYEVQVENGKLTIRAIDRHPRRR